MLSCYFTGHRTVYDAKRIEALLDAEIERHITEYGVTVFYVGNHGQFDHMVQRALVRAKKQHPHISARIALAYHPALRPVECPPELDGTYFPPGQENALPRYAITKLNRLMVREATHLIAYVFAVTDGSFALLRYARGREKRGALHIVNLTESCPPGGNFSFPSAANRDTIGKILGNEGERS